LKKTFNSSKLNYFYASLNTTILPNLWKILTLGWLIFVGRHSE